MTTINERLLKINAKLPDNKKVQIGRTKEPSENTKSIKLKLYHKLLKEQDGKCGICQEELTYRTSTIDYDTKSGKQRGLLCDLCNTGIGMFKENQKLLEQAWSYLETHKINAQFFKIDVDSQSKL